MEHGMKMPPCDGRLIRAHLIPRQVIKRAGGDPLDPRSWEWACGGPTGLGGHHGMLDYSRKLRIPRTDLPPELVEFALELGLVPWLDRTYGQLATVVR